MNEFFTFPPSGRLRSPFTEKFAAPRQPGLVNAAWAELHLAASCNREEILRGLSGFSHIWLIFVFHQVAAGDWSPTVRPPRLGGNQRLGVFATRSPFRPNPIGLSAVKLEGIENRQGNWLLHLSGVDLVDETPILDIKPYVPYADAITEADAGFTAALPDEIVTVGFSEPASASLRTLEADYPHLKILIQQVIGQQPQPGYRRGNALRRSYGMMLYDVNVRWEAEGTNCVGSVVMRFSTIGQGSESEPPPGMMRDSWRNA